MKNAHNGGKTTPLRTKFVSEGTQIKPERPKSVHGRRPPVVVEDRKDAGKILYPKPKVRPRSALHSSEQRQEQCTQTESIQRLRVATHTRQASGFVCPVTNPDLPPVGEMEHFVERCFCYLCTCGKHICPKVQRRRTTSSSMYATNYRVDYSRKSGEASKPMSAWLFSANRLPMDLQTVHQRDYQPYTIEHVAVPEPMETQPSVPFISRTSYQEMFPNWGPSGYAQIKPSNLPYRGAECKLDPKTTYAKDFQHHQATAPGVPRPPEAKCTSLMRTGVEFYGQTTNQGSYQPFKMDQMAVRARVPKERGAKMVAPRKHFKTTYKADYVPKQLPIRPLRLSQSLALL